MLTCPISAEFLQSIARWNPKVRNLLGRVEDQELAKRHPLRSAELPDGLPLEQAFCIAVAEAPDHKE